MVVVAFPEEMVTGGLIVAHVEGVTMLYDVVQWSPLQLSSQGKLAVTVGMLLGQSQD